jgi:N6-adenosine-specific RNA methylase IME4
MTDIAPTEPPRGNWRQRNRNAVSVVALRQGLATEIQGLMQDWASNTLTLGKKLKEARDTFPTANKSKFAPRPGWHEWIEEQFGFSPRWATDLINAYEKFGARTGVRALPSKVMRLLSGPDVPQAAVNEVLAKVEDGTVTEAQARQIVQAAKAIRAETARRNHAVRTERLAAISTNSMALPTGRVYPVLYADPPWHFEAYDSVTGTQRSPAYPTMTADEICALEVAQLAMDDAVLFLWTTSTFLKDAFQVIEAWGFEYAANIVWVKDETGRKAGLGHWVRFRHEHLLICKRGNFPAPLEEDRPLSVITAPRREHSRKPDEARQLIERMYPGLPKIELFARERHEGWDAWGNEVPMEDAA